MSVSCETPIPENPPSKQGNSTVALTTKEEEFKLYTAKSGDIARSLSIAGIALIWLLNNEDFTTALSDHLKIAFWCFSISLLLDFIQYAVGSILWGINWLKDKDENNTAADCTRTIYTLLVPIFSKIIAMMIGYISVVLHLEKICFL